MKPIISIEGLGKSYLVGHQSASSERYTALRDVVSRTVKDFGRKAIDMARGKQIIQGDSVEEFWALKDISFDVNVGEVVGIIGRNGAGKSTLLKVLSRITEPTKGRVTLRGRVASLLEVGTGFHPELTGRENIFLNGAVLGMARAEILRKFDEIVDFAEVEKFLDTPVKRYSSGMYVRLAFAVAAHLEPEILVVDEVLAVGDVEFQKKCLGKMKAVAKEGRTILFVTHNMTAVASFCSRVVCIRDGQLTDDGKPSDIVANYLASYKSQSSKSKWDSWSTAPGTDNLRIKEISISKKQDLAEARISISDTISVATEYWTRATDFPTHIIYLVLDEQGIVCFSTFGHPPKIYSDGSYRASFDIPGNWLNRHVHTKSLHHSRFSCTTFRK